MNKLIRDLFPQAASFMNSSWDFKGLGIWNQSITKTEQDWMQRAEILDKLEVILAFFPCELSTKKGPTSSESEKTELLALCEVCMASQEGLKRQQILAGSSNNTLGTNIDRYNLSQKIYSSPPR